MKPVDEQTIREMARRVARELEAERVILFGSRAEGLATPDSDVDLFVIVPRTAESSHDRAVRAHRCLRGLGVAKDVVIRTRDEVDRYRDVVGSLEHHVLTHGKVLYG